MLKNSIASSIAYFVRVYYKYTLTISFHFISLTSRTYLLATLLLLGELDVLPDEINSHFLEGLRLDTELLLRLARVSS